MTQHHLAIAMEYAPGGDLSEYVDACKRAGVRFLTCTACLSKSVCCLCVTAALLCVCADPS